MHHWPRAILHVDMDAFFASVEQLDNPELRNRPVVVGGTPEGRGVVSAASYEARAYGIHSAMPAGRARRLCPHAVFLRGRMERYKEMSQAVHEVFARFTPAIQPVSVDEAFLDITGSQRLFGPPSAIAARIKKEVRAETGLTASVGVAPTRFVAKVASDLEKPDGLVVIPEDEVLDRLAPLAVSRIWGVGKVTARALTGLGIRTIADLRAYPRDVLAANLGDAGRHLYDLARGVDPSAVREADPEKSISNEITFSRDIEDLAQLETILLGITDKVAGRVRKAGLRGRTVQIKVRYEDFSTVTRRVTLPADTCVSRDIYAAAVDLLRRRTEAGARPVRLLGAGLSGFSGSGSVQPGLFSPVCDIDPRKTEDLERTTDAIRAKHGLGAIQRGSLLRSEGEKKKRNSGGNPAGETEA